MRIEVTLDCLDLTRLAAFWSVALGHELEPSPAPGYLHLVPRDAGGVSLSLQEVSERKAGKNRMHLDVLVADPDTEAARLESLGATRSTPDWQEMYGQRWLVMLDPEGNEFCLAGQ